MKRVLLLCSIHHEMGLANVSELHSLLERIRPEVIFLEISPVHLDDYINTWTHVEAATVRRYRHLHPATLTPVDVLPIPAPLAAHKQTMDYLFARVEQANPELRSLNYWNDLFAGVFGFAYLNSASNNAVWSAIHRETRTTVEALGDRTLIEVYDMWLEANRQREEAMMNAVDVFAKQNSFDIGVWFVGAAHRQPIIDLSRRERGVDSPVVQSDLAGYLKQPKAEA